MRAQAFPRRAYTRPHLCTYAPEMPNTHAPAHLHTYQPSRLHTFEPSRLYSYTPTDLHTCVDGCAPRQELCPNRPHLDEPCQTLNRLDQMPAKLCRFGPVLAEIWSSLVKSRQMSSKVGRCGAKSGQYWPSLPPQTKNSIVIWVYVWTEQRCGPIYAYTPTHLHTYTPMQTYRNPV